MPSADCPSAIASLTARTLRGVASFVSSSSRTRTAVRQLQHAEVLVNRLPHSGVFYSQSLGLSRGTPDCFRCVTVESTWRAAVRYRTGNKAFPIVLHPHPAYASPVSTGRVSVHLPTLYVRPTSSSRASSRDRYRHSLCLRLPFGVTTWGWTCSLICTRVPVTFVTNLNAGTFSERTS